MKLFFLNTTNWSECECWGTHKWVVAVLACPKHGWNRRFSTPYPIVDLSKFSPAIPDRALQLAEFEDIKVHLRSLVPAQLEILPCQSYGPLKAEAHGKLGDAIMVVGNGTSCMRLEKFEELKKRGLPDLQGVEAKVKYKREPGIRVMEMQIQGHVRLGSPSFPNGKTDYCPICRKDIGLKKLGEDQVTVKKSSIPKQGDVFGLLDWHQGMIVTEHFVEVAQGILGNAKFDEIRLVDE